MRILSLTLYPHFFIRKIKYTPYFQNNYIYETSFSVKKHRSLKNILNNNKNLKYPLARKNRRNDKQMKEMKEILNFFFSINKLNFIYSTNEFFRYEDNQGFKH